MVVVVVNIDLLEGQTDREFLPDLPSGVARAWILCQAH